MIIARRGTFSDRWLAMTDVSNTQLVVASGTFKGSVRPDTERRVKSYFANFYSRRTSMDVLAFLKALPAELRDELSQQIHWIDGWVAGHEVFGLLHKVPFFAGLSNTACIGNYTSILLLRL
jgi:hypothetical protein